MNTSSKIPEPRGDNEIRSWFWAPKWDVHSYVECEAEKSARSSRFDEISRHIGFIMDGNRRWATAKNLAKHLGHHRWAETTEEIVELCVKNEIKIVSFWALAKKNVLERSSQELEYLYGLFAEFLGKIEASCVRNGIRFEMVGDMDLLPESLQNSIRKLCEITASFEKMILILAIGYGGQDEIVRAVKRAIREWVDPDTLDEKSFLKYLDTGAFPPPDLIVRTGGDIRHSGYFLYQAEYSEYYFTETLWPDFGKEEFYAALKSLRNARRNFWK